jgi:glycosyltransferase involved in cell wall biosynthesis
MTMSSTSHLPMKVSVIIVTFNHEQFIAEAIRSVLAQKTSFPYEIIISEDCSSDQTRSIVGEFHATHPDQIRVLLSNYNLCTSEVLLRALVASQGDYVALLDGDDYWTCSTKLQRQVEFLDTHSEYSLCHHNMHVLEDGIVTRTYNPPTQPKVSHLRDLILSNFIATGSVMFRRIDVSSFPPWFSTVYCGDWALHVLNCLRGQIGYLSESLGVYRVHSGGAWSGLSELQQLEHLISFCKAIRQCLGFLHRMLARGEESRLRYRVAKKYCEMGKPGLAFGCLRKMLYDLPSFIMLLLYLTNRKFFRVARRTCYHLRLQFSSCFRIPGGSR